MQPRPVPSFRQVIGRLSPDLGESSRQYLRRVAGYWSYAHVWDIYALAGANESAVDCADFSEKFAFALRLSVPEWKMLANTRSLEKEFRRTILFSEHRIAYGQVTYTHPRVCIECLRESLVERRVWELGLMVACARHGCYLIDACPECGRRLERWQSDLHICTCRYDLRNSQPCPADERIVAISAAIEFAADRIPKDLIPSKESTGFPVGIWDLTLNELLQLISFLGETIKGDTLHCKRRGEKVSDLRKSVPIVNVAARVLEHWPSEFLRVLKSNIPKTNDIIVRYTIPIVFGQFYLRLYEKFSGPGFSFLRNAFRLLILEHWRGPIAPRQKWVISPDSIENFGWCRAAEIGRSGRRLDVGHLIMAGKLDGFLARSPKSSKSGEWWISKESLRRWQANNPKYIPLRDMAKLLGLSWQTTLSVARAGIIQYTQTRKGAPFMLLRDDGLKLLHAFESCDPPSALGKGDPHFISLNQAMRSFLWHSGRLIPLLWAIMDGRLAPVARTSQYPGVTGYIFSIAALRMSSHLHCPERNCSEYLNISESAIVLNTSIDKVSALVASRVLASVQGRSRKGRNEVLIAKSDIDAFSEQYVSSESVAKLFGIACRTLVARLRERSVPLLVVHVHSEGNGRVFIPRAIADTLEGTPNRLSTQARNRRVVEPYAA